jgi:DNA-binding MarR family transcriptional regulator
MTELLDDFDFKLWMLLRQAYDAVHKVRDKELEQYNITTRQSSILHGIKVLDNKATIADLSKWVVREQHTVSNILKRMENEQLVIKSEPERHRQPAVYSLTKQGEDAFIQSIEFESIHEAMSTFNEEESRLLADYLRKLRDKAASQLREETRRPFP